MSENHDKPSERPAFSGLQYYAELNRIIAILFAGVLALMTFLLTVGYQRPHADFSYALYASIVILGLNLVAYVVGHMFYVQTASLRPTSDSASAVSDEKSEDKDESKDKDVKTSKAAKSNFEAARQRLRVIRLIQQILFVAAVIAITWLAIATAHFFFTIPTTPTTGTGAGQ